MGSPCYIFFCCPGNFQGCAWVRVVLSIGIGPLGAAASTPCMVCRVHRLWDGFSKKTRGPARLFWQYFGARSLARHPHRSGKHNE